VSHGDRSAINDKVRKREPRRRASTEMESQETERARKRGRETERSSEASELEPTNRSPNEMNVLITGSGSRDRLGVRVAGRRGARGHEMETLSLESSRAARTLEGEPSRFTSGARIHLSRRVQARKRASRKPTFNARRGASALLAVFFPREPAAFGPTNVLH